MKRLSLICLITAFFTLGGCANNTQINTTQEPVEIPPTETNASQTPVYRKITPEEAKQMMEDGEDYILLDVRTEEEYTENRIDGAVLIPDLEIKERAQAELTDKDARILVYCRSGRRSAQAAADLLEMGYTNVYDIGGINDWPYETVEGD